jgi:aldehyde:ferredoxin oxidoreductase
MDLVNPSKEANMAEQFGYTGKILRVDLSSSRVTSMPTIDYADRFIGGMGIAAKIYWDEVSPDVRALEPENPLIFITGPLAGFTGLAGSMWQVHSKSPLIVPEHFSYGSLGGTWGAHLKFAGYDGILIKGKSEQPVYLLVEDDAIQIRDASNLWGMNTVETRQVLKSELGSSAKVATIGPAGENLVAFANILADDDSSASVGMGAVMGSKNLKAVVVRGRGKLVAAKPERLRELARHLKKLKEGATQTDFGLILGSKVKKQACYGCISGCHRATMEGSDGDIGKFMCQSAIFYQIRAQRYYGEWNEVPFYANRFCDKYGIDTRVVETMLAWLTRCHRAGILTDDNTALPLSKFGSLEFIESLVKKIAFREGFGDTLALGTIGAANALGSEAKALITDYVIHSTGQAFDSDPRMDILTGLLYVMQPREHAAVSEISSSIGKWREWTRGVERAYVSGDILRAISRRFLGEETAVDFSIDEGKGQAVKKIQDRWSARESLILCGFTWPITDIASSDDHVGDPTLESQAFSAVTGKDMDEASLNRMGEVIFNLRRAIFAREGRKGRSGEVLPEIFYNRPYIDRANPEDPCLMPGKNGKAISRKGAVVDRREFEKLKDDYYHARQWDVTTGLQTKRKLEELGLHDVAKYMVQKELAV